MLRLTTTVFLISLLPSALYADTTVYACKKDGQTTLESILSQDCDSVQTFHYQSFSNANQNQSDLRPGEIQQLQGLDNSQHRYNVDPRVGWSLAHDYMDTRQEKCAFYQAMLNRAMGYISVRNEQLVEIGPHRSAELMARIQQAQSQVNYYCP